MLSFACFVPHAPILLPEVGSRSDREKVKETINSLESLAPKLAAINPEIIIITSPHPDWGINVPLHFLLAQVENSKLKIQSYLTKNASLMEHFNWGKEIARKLPKEKQIAWIASGDMSHTLKEDGPYGFNPSGPVFDKKFIELLKKKDIKAILEIDEKLIEEAGVCGIWSFCLLLGALDELKINWKPKILSYEGPFGVGYLVAEAGIILKKNTRRGK